MSHIHIQQQQMSYKPTTDHILQNNLFCARHKARSHEDTGITGPSHSTDTKTATIIPLISELSPNFLTRHSQQNIISPRTNFTMGPEPLNRQLFPEVKAIDL